MNDDKITILFDDEYIKITNPLAAQNVYYFDEKGEKIVKKWIFNS